MMSPKRKQRFTAVIAIILVIMMVLTTLSSAFYALL